MSKRTTRTYLAATACKAPAPPARPPAPPPPLAGPEGEGGLPCALVRVAAFAAAPPSALFCKVPCSSPPDRGARPPASRRRHRAPGCDGCCKRRRSAPCASTSQAEAPAPARALKGGRKGGDTGWEKGAGTAAAQPTGSCASRCSHHHPPPAPPCPAATEGCLSPSCFHPPQQGPLERDGPPSASHHWVASCIAASIWVIPV